MAAFGNTTRNDLIKFILQDIDPSWANAANLYVSFHTANPGFGGSQTTSEFLQTYAVSPAPYRHFRQPPPCRQLQRGSRAQAQTLQAEMLRRLWRIHGLDETAPLVVDGNSRTAGDVEQTIVKVGGTTTVTKI